MVYFPHFEQEDEVIEDELWHNYKTKFDKLIEKQKKHVKEWGFKLLKGKDLVVALNENIEKSNADVMIFGRNSNYY